MNNKVNLEVLYKIEEISTYKEGERNWDDSGLSFTFKVEDKIGKLTISAKGLSIDVDEIKRKKNDIETALENFLLSLKFSINELNLSYTEKYLNLLHNFSYQISSDSDIERAVKMINGEKVENNCDVTLSIFSLESNLNCKIDLPKYFCTSFDENLRRNLFTFLQTKEIGSFSENYHDDMLKRWFLILDEIETDRGNADFAKILNARNFISHYYCDKKNVVSFIKKELPKAICTIKGKEEARFDRLDNEHIEFIKKYERLAEKQVRNLLNKKLDENCCYDNRLNKKGCQVMEHLNSL